MRYGVMALDLNQVDAIADAGYDCVELNVSDVMKLSNTEFKSFKNRLSETGLHSNVFYEPLPPDITICTRGFNTFVWREYIKDVCFRVSELGGRKFVFSNGNGRSIPIKGDLHRARESVMAFIKMLCDIANEYEITVMIEPLDESLTNMYNTLDECSELIGILGMPNLTAMCSLRYFSSAGTDDILKYKKIIDHVHIDYPNSPNSQRLCPKENDGYNYKSFFEVLNKIDYSGLVSVIADTYIDYESDIKLSLAFIKAFANK